MVWFYISKTISKLIYLKLETMRDNLNFQVSRVNAEIWKFQEKFHWKLYLAYMTFTKIWCFKKYWKHKIILKRKFNGLILIFSCPGETLKYEIFRERLFGNSNLLIWPLISFDSEIDIKKLELFKTENLVADSYFQLSRGNAEMWKL